MPFPVVYDFPISQEVSQETPSDVSAKLSPREILGRNLLGPRAWTLTVLTDTAKSPCVEVVLTSTAQALYLQYLV